MEPAENAPQPKTGLHKSRKTLGRRKWWRRLPKVVVALVAIVVFGVGYLVVDDKYGNRLWPKRVTELHGIKIGATRADVLFKKGAPDFTDDDTHHHYQDDSSVYSVQYAGDKVIRLKLHAVGDYRSFPRVAGIVTGDYELWLTRELGEPDSTHDEEIAAGAVRRYYHYVNLGVVFSLEQDRVVGIIVE